MLISISVNNSIYQYHALWDIPWFQALNQSSSTIIIGRHCFHIWQIIPGAWPPKNGTVDLLFLRSDQQLSFFTLLDRASFPHYNNTKINKFGWEVFILWVISYGLSFSRFAINMSLLVLFTEQSIQSICHAGLCSNQQLSSFTLVDGASFLHYNNTKIIKFGWELFILWVISYELSQLSFEIWLICH